MEPVPAGRVGSAPFSNLEIIMARARKAKSSSKSKRNSTMSKGGAKRASAKNMSAKNMSAKKTSAKSRTKGRAKAAKPRKAKKGALSKLLSSLPLVS